MNLLTKEGRSGDPPFCRDRHLGLLVNERKKEEEREEEEEASEGEEVPRV